MSPPVNLETEMIARFKQLPPEDQQQVLGFMEGLLASRKPRGTPPSAFKPLRGTLSREAAERMKQIIEEDCERIEPEPESGDC